jgi:hypothetical protein
LNFWVADLRPVPTAAARRPQTGLLESMPLKCTIGTPHPNEASAARYDFYAHRAPRPEAQSSLPNPRGVRGQPGGGLCEYESHDSIGVRHFPIPESQYAIAAGLVRSASYCTCSPSPCCDPSNSTRTGGTRNQRSNSQTALAPGNARLASRACAEILAQSRGCLRRQCPSRGTLQCAPTSPPWGRLDRG